MAARDVWHITITCSYSAFCHTQICLRTFSNTISILRILLRWSAIMTLHSNSRLSGTLPPELATMQALEMLDVSFSLKLSGTVPANYANLPRLDVLSVIVQSPGDDLGNAGGIKGPYPSEICDNGLSPQIITEGGASDCPCCVKSCTKFRCDGDYFDL